MATRRIMLVVLTVMITIAFGTFGQKAFGAEPNAPVEKKVERKNHKGEHGMMGDRVKMRMAELSARLNLTEDQKKSVQPIVENELKEMQALKGDASLSKEQRMEKMQSIRQTSQEEMKKVLTPEQQAKLEVKEEKKAEMKEGVKGDASARIQKRMMELNEKLALTPDQKKSIQPIIENEMKDADAVKSDQSLSKEQKIEKVKAIHQTSHDEMMKVLTPEQQTKLEAMKEKAHDKKAELKGKGQQ